MWNKIIKIFFYLGVNILFFLKLFLLSIFSVSPMVCLFWTFKEILRLETFNGRFAFLVIWLLSCTVSTIIYIVQVAIKHKKMYSAKKK